MTIHESCTTQNDMAYSSPIEGKRTIRKQLGGIWTRTIITLNDCGVSSGRGRSFGPGGSGEGILIRKGKIKDGGRSSRPEQELLTFTGGA